MIKFYPHTLFAMWNSVQNATCSLSLADAPDRPDPKAVMKSLEQVREALLGFDEQCKRFQMSNVLLALIEQVRMIAEAQTMDPRMHAPAVVNACVSLTRPFFAAIGEHAFLLIPAVDRDFIEQKTPLLGQEVDAAFPSARDEISSAGRCFALDEHTACVFHLMRALEKGLYALGAQLGLDEAALSQENWQNIIEQIEKKRKQFEVMPKGPVKTEALTAYSEAAVQFLNFKDAWRNHVAHGRKRFDRRGASVVIGGVDSFLRALANNGVAENASQA